MPATATAVRRSAGCWWAQNRISSVKQIAILFRNWSTRRYEALRGVADYAQTTPDWSLAVLDDVRDADEASRLSSSRLDGLITCLDGASPEFVAAVTGLGVPTINVGTAIPELPSVSVDVTSMADLAADQFAPHGLSSLAFVSTPGHQRLANGLAVSARQRGWNFHQLETDLSDSCMADSVFDETIHDFIDSTTMPVGIVTSCDLLAVALKRSIDRLGAKVPERIPLISARDSFHCAMSEDSITAICEPTYELGVEAARMMSMLLNGYDTPPRPVTVDATELNVRVSTVDPAADRLVVRAMTFIHDNASRGINVPDILAFLDVSRVTFERRFREAVGCSPGEEIRRVRLEHARNLLLKSDAPIAEISRDCGFDTPNRFSTFFRNGTGQTPTDFRRDNSSDCE